MRHILIFCFSIIIYSHAYSQSELVFTDISYADLFKTAMEEQKPVFMFFYFDGCSACKQMEKNVFVNEEVADLYNENFICFEVNTLKSKGIEVNKNYNVKIHPTFLFLSETGDLIHKAVGVFNPDEFILEAEAALDPEKSLRAFREHYDDGERSEDFLYSYCYKQRNAYELDSLTINEYLSTQSFNDLTEEKNIRFIYEFIIHHFNITMPYESREFQFMLENKGAFSKYFPEEQVNTRIAWILNSTIYQAIEEGNRYKYLEVLALLEKYDRDRPYYFKEMDGRTTGMVSGNNMALMAEMTWYEKTGNEEKYKKALNDYITNIWDDASALNSFAWNYYTQYEEKEQLAQALKWIERSIELKAGYDNTDTYAALLYKLGKYEEALKQAKIAIELAKKEEIDFSGSRKLIEQIKDQQAEQYSMNDIALVNTDQASAMISFLQSVEDTDDRQSMIDELLNMKGTQLILDQMNLYRKVSSEQYRELLENLKGKEFPQITPLDEGRSARRGVDGLREVWKYLQWSANHTGMITDRLVKMRSLDIYEQSKNLALANLPEPVDIAPEVYIVAGGRAGAAALDSSSIYYDITKMSYMHEASGTPYTDSVMQKELTPFLAHEMHHIGFYSLMRNKRTDLARTNKANRILDLLEGLVAEGSATYLVDGQRNTDNISFFPDIEQQDQLLARYQDALRLIINDSIKSREEYNELIAGFTGNSPHIAGTALLSRIDKAFGLEKVMECVANPIIILEEHNKAINALADKGIDYLPLNKDLVVRLNSLE